MELPSEKKKLKTKPRLKLNNVLKEAHRESVEVVFKYMKEEYFI